MTGEEFSGRLWHGKGTVYREPKWAGMRLAGELGISFMGYFNYKKLVNFDKILQFAEIGRFPKICDFCGELFEADLILELKVSNHIKCPICHSIYNVVYNEWNDFYYLEFVISPAEFSVPEVSGIYNLFG